MPHNSVVAITQTRDGYIWLGTADGLARFDGVQFKRFGLADGLSSLYVRVLLEDREGGLWIGTVNGLSRFFNGRFTTWNTSDGLAGNVILALAEDPDGAIWIGTNTGLSRWRNGTFEAIGLQLGIAARYVAAVVADRQGAVWVSAYGLGLVRWDRKAFTIVTNIPGTQTALPSRILQDSAGRIWAGASGCIFCFEGQTWTKYGPEDGVPNVGITSLAEGAAAAIWAGTIDESLVYLRDGKFHRVGQKDGLSDVSILSLFEDREKNLWVGTRAGGLNRLKPRRVFTWCHVEDGIEVPPMSMTESSKGLLLMASQGRGIYGFESRGGDRFVRETLEALPNSLPLGALLTAHDGSLWWGSTSRLLQWKDGKLIASYSDKLSLRGDSVRCLQEDRDRGMWIGTRDGRLILLRDDGFITITNGLPGGMFTSLAQQPDGTLWVGSYGGGLGRVKQGVGSVLEHGQGLRSELVRALFLDSQADLWIGTEGGGLSCFADGAIRNLGAEQGLDDDTVLQILEDNSGDLWLGTYHGIYQLFRRELQSLLAGRIARVHPRRFGRSDGLLSEQCVACFGTCLRRRSGQLCFATDRGIAVIDPGRQGAESPLLAVRLEEVMVNGQAQQLPGRLPSDEEEGENPPAVLRIPPGGQRFEFHYTGLNYSAPEKLQFRFKLQGLDADWVEAGARRTAYYSYLPPGNYQFQVSAHNGNGLWSEPGADATLVLALLPHFWQTRWFQFGAALLGLGAAAAATRIITVRKARRRLKEMERQHAMERERARIAKDIHDDLGASLTHITMLTQSVREKLHDSSEADPELSQIYGTARELTRAMDEVVWAVSPKHDSLDSLAAYLGTFAQDFAAASHLRCRLDLPANLSEQQLSSQVRHNVFLAFKEALNNIAKHASASEVRITLGTGNGTFELAVEDNGRGFRAEEAASATAVADGQPARLLTGHGLSNMRSRLEEIGGHCNIESQYGLGTRVRFVVPLAAALSHK